MCGMRTGEVGTSIVDVPSADGRRDAGFALALVLLALVGMTTLAMAGFLRVNTDYKITQNHRASIHAFNAADAGRAQWIGAGQIRTDTLSYTFVDGAADVWAERLLVVDGQSSLYRLRSVGDHAAPEGGIARRELSSIVIFAPAGFDLNAAITSPAGLNKNGASGTVDGHDSSTPADCPTGGSNDVAGLQVPPGGFGQNGGGGGKGKGKGGGGGASGFDGVPPIDSTSTAAQMLVNLGIDWQGLLDGSFAQADYIESQDGYPNFGSIPSSVWPLVLIDSNSYSFNPPKSGHGTLVIQGDATFNGSFSWDGIILIGGQLTSNGNQTIRGAVVTGLNLMLGQNPAATDVGNGTWDYQYHSCNVLAALSHLGAPVEEPHTWAEIF